MNQRSETLPSDGSSPEIGAFAAAVNPHMVNAAPTKLTGGARDLHGFRLFYIAANACTDCVEIRLRFVPPAKVMSPCCSTIARAASLSENSSGG